MGNRIQIAAPDIGEAEIGAVVEVLKSGGLAQGKKVAEFEQGFAEYCGVEYAVMTNSGTAAIHCALEALGIGPGDEVVTTPFSFIATANPILMQGADVVFADIDPETFNIDPASIEEVISERTRAIIAVDLFGQPADYDQINSIAQQHGIAVIEDACQAVGAEYGGTKAGALGAVACFSLYPTKNITSGEGGVLTTGNSRFGERAKEFRQHGMRGAYDYHGIGYNYRSTDIAAAIAVEQLRKVDSYNEARAKNANQLDAVLAGIAGIQTPKTKPGRKHVYHQYTIRVGEDFPLSRDELRRRLDESDIASGVYYPLPLNKVPHIREVAHVRTGLDESDRATREVLSLPVHPKVTEEQVERIGAAVRKFADAG